jgi:hypothetical protein
LPGSGGSVSFKYDPFGRRIEKITSSTTSIYAYDGDNLIEETSSSGTAVARYSQTRKIDEPLAVLLWGHQLLRSRWDRLDHFLEHPRWRSLPLRSLALAVPEIALTGTTKVFPAALANVTAQFPAAPLRTTVIE